MCEFCTKHGEGKKWYLNTKNYAVEMLQDLKRRDFISNFYDRFMVKGGKSISRMERIVHKRPSTLARMAEAYENEMRENHFGQVVPVEDVHEIINMSNSIVRFACGCMWEAGRKEGRYCFGVSFGAPAWYDIVDRDYFGSPDVSRMEYLTKEEAVSCISRLDREGMVHSVWTFGTPFIGTICNCDMEYCLGMRATYGLGMKTMFSGEEKVVIDHDKCTSCGACRSICQMDAIDDSGPDGTSRLYPDKCIGCGVCRSVCGAEAVTYPGDRGNTHVLKVTE